MKALQVVFAGAGLVLAAVSSKASRPTSTPEGQCKTEMLSTVMMDSGDVLQVIGCGQRVSSPVGDSDYWIRFRAMDRPAWFVVRVSQVVAVSEQE